jgi:hypothetical protein
MTSRKAQIVRDRGRLVNVIERKGIIWVLDNPTGHLAAAHRGLFLEKLLQEPTRLFSSVDELAGVLPASVPPTALLIGDCDSRKAASLLLNDPQFNQLPVLLIYGHRLEWELRLGRFSGSVIAPHGDIIDIIQDFAGRLPDVGPTRLELNRIIWVLDNPTGDLAAAHRGLFLEKLLQEPTRLFSSVDELAGALPASVPPVALLIGHCDISKAVRLLLNDPQLNHLSVLVTEPQSERRWRRALERFPGYAMFAGGDIRIMLIFAERQLGVRPTKIRRKGIIWVLDNPTGHLAAAHRGLNLQRLLQEPTRLFSSVDELASALPARFPPTALLIGHCDTSKAMRLLLNDPRLNQLPVLVTDLHELWPRTKLPDSVFISDGPATDAIQDFVDYVLGRR